MNPMTLSFRTKTTLRPLGSVLVPRLSSGWMQAVSREPGDCGFADQVDAIERELRATLRELLPAIRHQREASRDRSGLIEYEALLHDLLGSLEEWVRRAQLAGLLTGEICARAIAESVIGSMSLAWLLGDLRPENPDPKPPPRQHSSAIRAFRLHSFTRTGLCKRAA